MVEILKELMIQTARQFTLYWEDSTRIGLEENREIEKEVISGIRQGCTSSSVLFEMITYKIIEEREKQKK